MEKKFGKMIITLENVDQAQAIALKKMFEYMEYLGNIGSSRLCSFFADGDGDFHPKVSIEYSEELPDVPEINGILTFEEINEAYVNNRKIINTCEGDFVIDFDSIAWKIYH
jgi:hypothetical protein